MPSQHIRGELAKKLGMSSRRVQIWFQNKRAKLKRISKQDPPRAKKTSFESSKSGSSSPELESTSGSPPLVQNSISFPMSNSLRILNNLSEDFAIEIPLEIQSFYCRLWIYDPQPTVKGLNFQWNLYRKII
jgi:hypothetical protein